VALERADVRRGLCMASKGASATINARGRDGPDNDAAGRGSADDVSGTSRSLLVILSEPPDQAAARIWAMCSLARAGAPTESRTACSTHIA